MASDDSLVFTNGEKVLGDGLQLVVDRVENPSLQYLPF